MLWEMQLAGASRGLSNRAQVSAFLREFGSGGLTCGTCENYREKKSRGCFGLSIREEVVVASPWRTIGKKGEVREWAM